MYENLQTFYLIFFVSYQITFLLFFAAKFFNKFESGSRYLTLPHSLLGQYS